MQDILARLADRPLTLGGPVTRICDKNDLQRRLAGDWIARTDAARGRSLEQVWRIREECIAALSAEGRREETVDASPTA